MKRSFLKSNQWLADWIPAWRKQGLPHHVSATDPSFLSYFIFLFYTYSYNSLVPRSVRRTLPWYHRYSALLRYGVRAWQSHYFFTIHFPLLLEPCLSTNPSSRKSFIIFWTCFLVRLNSSISLTCVIVDSSFILCKIFHFFRLLFSSPFFGSFLAPFWLFFGSFLFTFLLSRSQKCFMHK